MKLAISLEKARKDYTDSLGRSWHWDDSKKKYIYQRKVKGITSPAPKGSLIVKGGNYYLVGKKDKLSKEEFDNYFENRKTTEDSSKKKKRLPKPLDLSSEEKKGMRSRVEILQENRSKGSSRLYVPVKRSKKSGITREQESLAISSLSNLPSYRVNPNNTPSKNQNLLEIESIESKVQMLDRITMLGLPIPDTTVIRVDKKGRDITNMKWQVSTEI